jgi:shikimate kinase
MRGGHGIEGVLITGAYGSGKSAVATEMADRLEERSFATQPWISTGSRGPIRAARIQQPGTTC